MSLLNPVKFVKYLKFCAKRRRINMETPQTKEERYAVSFVEKMISDKRNEVSRYVIGSELIIKGFDENAFVKINPETSESVFWCNGVSHRINLTKRPCEKICKMINDELRKRYEDTMEMMDIKVMNSMRSMCNTVSNTIPYISD